jgi:ABC-type transport system substrate-binding protein
MKPYTCKLFAVAAGAAMALSLAACGDGTSGTGGTAGNSGDAAAPAKSDIVISYPAVHQSFDPVATVATIDRAVNGQYGAGLVRMGMDGKVVLDLAENIELAADYASAKVTMKAGLTFSDGSPLGAKDVAATFTRHMGIESSNMKSLTNWFESVTAADETTVDFVFTAPFPSFVEYMCTEGALIFPAAAMEKDDPSFWDLPVAAGPYKLTAPWGSNKLLLERNDKYHGQAAPFDTITFYSIEDANNAVQQLKAGQVDFAADLPPNYVEQLKGVEGVNAANIQGWGFYDLRFNNKAELTNDPKVRNAIDMALDREAMVASFWGGDNTAFGGFMPPTLDGYDESYNRPRDVEGAKQLLKGTDCETGCSIDFMYSASDFPFASQLALLVQAQLAEIGITVELENLDQATLVDRLFAGDYQIAPGAMNSSGPFPDGLILLSLDPTSGINAEFTFYDNPAMAELVTTVTTTLGDQRNNALTELQKLFDQDQPLSTYAIRVTGQATTLPTDQISLVGTMLVIG